MQRVLNIYLQWNRRCKQFLEFHLFTIEHQEGGVYSVRTIQLILNCQSHNSTMTYFILQGSVTVWVTDQVHSDQAFSIFKSLKNFILLRSYMFSANHDSFSQNSLSREFKCSWELDLLLCCCPTFCFNHKSCLLVSSSFTVQTIQNKW